MSFFSFGKKSSSPPKQHTSGSSKKYIPYSPPRNAQEADMRRIDRDREYEQRKKGDFIY